MIRKFEQVMKAAGDPTRARILKLLEGGELTVGQMVAVIRARQSTVSSHLAVLSRAGLVTWRRDGRQVWYGLSSSKQNRYAPAVLALLVGWLDDDPQVRADKRRRVSLGARPGKQSK